MSARTEPRFTRDVDVAVLVESDGAAEQLVRSLTSDGYGLSALVEQDAVGRLATVRLISPKKTRRYRELSVCDSGIQHPAE